MTRRGLCANNLAQIKISEGAFAVKIYVCVKQVPDTETRIKIAASGDSIEQNDVKWILCPYDEFAIEEALRFKEKNAGATVTVISGGPDRVAEALRTALAMGCDEAALIDLPANADSFLTAKALAKTIQKLGAPHLVFTGKQAIDDDAAQVTQAMAEFLDMPAVTVVLKAEYGASLKLSREIEGGMIEQFDAPIPCVLAAQKGLNEPRYASLPNIMKAKKKEIKKIPLSELGVDAGEVKLKYSGFTLPAERKGCKMIAGDVAAQAKELVKLLHEEAKVI
jgi:electron transfer flavoprotein beta subunit